MIFPPFELGAGQNAQPSFSLDLVTSLVPIYAAGSGVPTMVRATTAYQTDFEGKLNAVLSGEPRFQGARRVQNHIPAPENLNGAGWTKQAGATVTNIGGGEWEVDISACADDQGVFVQGTPAATQSTVISFYLKVTAASGNNILKVMEPAAAAFATFNTPALTTSWQRIATPVFTATGVANGFWLVKKAGVATATLFRIKFPQSEKVTGQTNQAPSEYVSVGVLSAPYHGAGVDGVKYFSTLNGNTVASNVVTEATGAAINSAAAAAAGGVTAGVVDAYGPLGYLSEGQRIQYLGVTAAPATQTTASLGTGTYTLWITGTGSATSSAGTATITGEGAATAGTPNVFVVTVAGTVVVTVAGSPTLFQLENGAFPSSYIANAGAAGTAVTRNADVLTYPSAGNISNTQGSTYVERYYRVVPIGNDIGVGFGNASGYYSYINGTPKAGIFDGTNNALTTSTVAVNTLIKQATSWDAAGINVLFNGGAVATAAYDGSFGAGVAIQIGDGASALGTIRNVRIYATALPSSRLVAMTT